MQLISYEFLLLTVLLLFLYYVVPGKLQWILLLLGSILFYAGAGAGVTGFCFFGISILSTWAVGRKIGAITEESRKEVKERGLTGQEKRQYIQRMKRREKRWMHAGLFLNFALLLVLKYTNFLLENLNVMIRPSGYEFEPVRWLLPLGISYYTLQVCGYLIDLSNRKYQPEKNLARYALFVSYFPQITQGPVCRFDETGAELCRSHSFRARNLEKGLLRALWGLFKKLVVADRIAPAALAIAEAPDSFRGIYVLIGMFVYTIWMYSDFTGGIDLVLGISEAFGIALPENFNHPFFSRSMAEFWRRWHMTLMRWLREYVFFPVSMSGFVSKLSGTARKRFGNGAARRVPLYIASVTVWLAAGLWHGASWHFVCWGMANCIVLLLSQELSPVFKKWNEKTGFKDGKIPDTIRIIRTFLLFCMLEMFEYYPLRRIPELFLSMFTEFRPLVLSAGMLEELGLTAADAAVTGIAAVFMILIGILGVRAEARADGKEQEKGIRSRYFSFPVPVRVLILYGLFLAVLILGVYGQGYDARSFIYNQY